MKKTTYISIIAIIIFLSFWGFQKSANNGNFESNASLLKKGSELDVIAESKVSYFEGAKGYFVRPEKEGEYPGIVIIHENRGLRPEIKTAADELAKEGYIVLAIDLLGNVVNTQEEARALTANYDQDQGVQNMKSAVRFLKNKGAVKVASLGWCFGGAQSLELALSGEKMDATLIYYGGLTDDKQKLSKITWPVLGIFGDEDQVVSVESVNSFKNSLDDLGIENEIYIYKGVGHAFANPSGASYSPDETKDAWRKSLSFLEKHLK